MLVPLSIFLYNVFIKLYEWAVYIVATQNEKAAKWISGRENLLTRIANDFKEIDPEKERIWMHCASLGEFEQGRPLIEALRQQKPEAIIVLTFFSPSGYEIRKNYPNADYVYYLPSDTKKNAREFLSIIRPSLVIFVKYEFWFHYFMETKKSDARFILISASFRKSQLFFKWYGGMYRKMLGALSHIFVQDQKSFALLAKNGFNNVTISGDTRIDRVQNIALHSRSLPTLEMFLHGEKAFTGGSIYPIENEFIRKAYLEKIIRGKIILAPHQVDTAHLQNILELWGDEAILYTVFNEKEAADKSVLIVDTIGMLSNIYKYTSMAMIGGGFGKGIHNTLEPAAFGIPIVFGPKYDKFKEAEEMRESGAAFSFEDYEGFKNILLKLQDEQIASVAGEKAREYIQANSGGTKKIIDWLETRGQESGLRSQEKVRESGE